MGIYNNFVYNDGTLYGDKSALDYSAAPIIVTPITYGTVAVDYTAPTGSYIQFRMVRNQNGYPETAEDGVILLDTQFPTGGTITDSGLITGKFVYYRAWIKKGASTYWVSAGDSFGLVASKHTISSGVNAVESVFSGKGLSKDSALVSNVEFSTTHTRFMSYFPGVITSTSLSPADEISSDYSNNDASGAESNTLISRFFEAFSFTFDEFLTYAKLIIPDNSNVGASPSVVSLKLFELGVGSYPDLSLISKKRLARDAIEYHGAKGTATGLKLFTQALTNYTTKVTETSSSPLTSTQSTNLMLSHFDSTFDIKNWLPAIGAFEADPVGNWSSGDGVSLQIISGDDKEVSTDEPHSLDDLYSLKASVNGLGVLSYGINNPVNNAIPVKSDTSHSFSVYVQGTGAITPNIIWYNSLGNTISVSSSTAFSTSSSWQRMVFEDVQAPVNAVYAGLQLNLNAGSNGYFYIDMVQFEQNEASTSYVEPRGVVLTFTPSKYNYINNPSFETVYSSSAPYGTELGIEELYTLSSGFSSTWTFNGCTSSEFETDLDIASGSVYMAKVDIAGSPGADITSTVTGAFSGNSFYTFSVYARSDYATQDAFLNITDGVSTHSVAILLENKWKRFSITLPTSTSPTEITSIITTQVTDRILFLDAAQLEKGSIATDYFDGNRIEEGGIWTGNENQSISVQYVNLNTKIRYLLDSINNYLPLSTPYYITFHGSNSFTELALSGIS